MVKQVSVRVLFYLVISIVLQGIAVLIYPVNHYVTGLISVLEAVFLYFYIVIRVANWNWMDIRALFSATWFCTIGLASLRLTDYQEEWKLLTWICLELVYVCIQIGCVFGEAISNKLIEVFSKHKLSKMSFKFSERRLFYCCVGVTLMGLICFSINVAIKGFIPFFSTDDSAYFNFYTKFHIFAVATTMISGPCYYCIKKCNLKAWQKVIMWLCIAYATFIYPTLIVSRGTFLTSALSLVAFIFYLNRKKLWILIASVTVIMGIYLLLSQARGYTNDQLLAFFEPSKIVVDKGPVSQKPPKDTTSDTDEPMTDTEDSTEKPGDEPNNEEVVFSLPGSVVFLYSYLTVSHDNFNAAIANDVDFSYGGRQLAPFNVILRIDALDNMLENQMIYKVRPHLNTINLAGYFYYDFGVFGVVFLSFIWGAIFMAIQKMFERTGGVFSLWALGNTMSPIILCFFTPWLSIFSHWMHWGLAFVIWIVASVSIIPKDTRSI